MPLSSAALRDALERSGLLVRAVGELPPGFADVADDSRRVVAGALFVAVRGSARDGHAFLDAAARAGATGAVV